MIHVDVRQTRYGGSRDDRSEDEIRRYSTEDGWRVVGEGGR